jgi:hypothetical protein
MPKLQTTMNKELQYYTNPSVKAQIDEHMHMMAIEFANTGKDSTFGEMKRAYKVENELIDKIAEIDSEFAKIIRPYEDNNG